MNTETPAIEYHGERYWQVGCKSCRRGEVWRLYTTGNKMIAQCDCEHISEIPPLDLEEYCELCGGKLRKEKCIDNQSGRTKEIKVCLECGKTDEAFNC